MRNIAIVEDNDNAAKMKQKLTDDERAKLVEEGKTLKAKIAEIEEESKKITDSKKYEDFEDARYYPVSEEDRKNANDFP